MTRLFILCLLCFSLGAMATPAPKQEGSQPDPQIAINAFIDEMVAKHHFEEKPLQDLFKRLHPQAQSIQSVKHPAEAKPWEVYQHFFVTEKRIKNGARFWRQYHKTLERAEKTYGVPPEIIVAILGVETSYGAGMGRYPEFDTLATLAFYYPKRQKFFRAELKEYLLMAREQHFDPKDLRGSYAGALGEPQFMPSSYRHYGVDFSGDGVVDLFKSPVDVIGSTANYLKKHGWHGGEPIAMKASVKGEDYKTLKSRGHRPKHTLAEWQKAGVTLDEKADPKLKAKLVTLHGKSDIYHWLGFNNYYALRSYNPRDVYALAVFELAQEVKKNYEQKS